MKILIGCENTDGLDLLINDLSRAGLPATSEVKVVTAIDSMASLATDSTSAAIDCSAEVSGSMQIDTAHLSNLATARAQKVVKMLATAFPQWDLKASGCIASPQWALIDEANKMGADLIVLGSKGHSLINRFFFGSVSHSVVNHATCSVRVVRLKVAPHTGPVRILAGVDGSPKANRAIEVITSRNWPADTEVRLVAAFDEDVLPLSVFGSQYSVSSIQAAIREEQAALETAVSTAGEAITAAGLNVSTAVRPGLPREVLIEEVNNFKADTLFLGAKGHSMIDRLLIGSTSAAMASQAPCSVEIVR